MVVRTYTLRLQASAAPLALETVSIPLGQFDQPESRFLDPAALGQFLGLNLSEGVRHEGPVSEPVLRDYLASLLWQAGPGRRSFGDSDLDDFETAIQSLMETLLHSQFIPVEESPLSGQSLTDIVKGHATLMTFGTATEWYGLTHHDPVIVFATPVVVVVVGAAVGAGERIQALIKSLGTKRRRK